MLFPNFHKKLSGFWKKTSLYFTSPMKIFKPKCNRKSSQNPFNFYSIKNSFWCIKLVALRYYFQIVTKSYRVVFEKKDHFTSPPIWKFSSPNVKAKKKKKKKKIHLILIQSKIPFESTKSLALGWYSQDFTKNYWVVFEKSSLYFTSHMKISKSKSNNKTPKNAFNFHSAKASIWVHMTLALECDSQNFTKLIE